MSLPVEKHPGDVAFPSSIIRQGEMNALVVTTGMKTFYGRTTKLVEEAHTKSHSQGGGGQNRRPPNRARHRDGDDITSIVGLLRHQAPLDILQFGLVLIVAAIPAAMPAVLSVCMTAGALPLAKKSDMSSDLVIRTLSSTPCSLVAFLGV